jgi:hypothetical protein
VLASALVREPGNDEALATRQSALQAEAAALLDELDQSRVFDDIGPMAVTGSYVSHLMCWRDLDVIEIYAWAYWICGDDHARPVPTSAGGVGLSHHRGLQPDTHSRCPKAQDRGLKALRLEVHCQSRCRANMLVRVEGDGRNSPPPGDAY